MPHHKGEMRKLSYKEFVRAYQSSKSTREVAEKMDISTAQVSNIGWILRKLGVPLQEFRRKPPTTQEVIELKKLAESYNKNGKPSHKKAEALKETLTESL